MRTTRRVVLLLVLLLAGATLLTWQGVLHPPLAAPVSAEGFDLDDGRGTRAFLAAPDDPLRFPLTGRDRRVRLWINANVAELEPGAHLEDAYHAVRVAVLDAAGRELSVYNWHHRLAVNWLAGPDGSVLPRRVYTDGDVAGTPVNTNLMYVDTSAPGARTLQIEPLPAASRRVLSVAVRVYSYQQLSGSEAQRRLQRTSASERVNLARNNVYGWSLMQPEERRNAIANRWRPLVPVGNPGLDFREARLILRDSDEVQVETGELLVADDVLLPGRVLTFGLRELDNRVSVVATPLADGAATRVALTWHARLGGAVSSHVLADGELTLQLGRGLLEVTASAPVRLQVNDSDGAQLEPALGQVRAWLVDAHRPLRVELAALAAATPLRIEARALRPTADTLQGVVPVGPAMSALVLDAQDEWQLVGGWTVRGDVDGYSWIESDRLALLGARSRTFMHAPPGTRLLRIESTQPVLVTVSNRPPGLVRRLRIPEGLYGSDPENPQLAWYLLTPQDADERLTSSGSRLLTVAAAPPGAGAWDDEPPDDIEARGERLLPFGAWRGVSVLEPLPPEATTPAAAVFVELPNTGGRVSLADDLGADVLTPRLVLARHPRQPLRVELDGIAAGVRQPGTGWVSLRLPAAAAGQHRLAITPPTRVLLSYPAPQQLGPRWRERLLQALDGELEYDISRTTPIDESLGIRVYSADPDRRRVRLHVRVTGHQRNNLPVPQFSFETVDVDLRLDPGVRLPVVAGLGGRGELEGGSGIMFLPLGPDLGRTSARLHVWADDPAGLLVSVIRTPDRALGRTDIFTTAAVPDAP